MRWYDMPFHHEGPVARTKTVSEEDAIVLRRSLQQSLDQAPDHGGSDMMVEGTMRFLALHPWLISSDRCTYGHGKHM